jgi:hypothetical protein
MKIKYIAAMAMIADGVTKRRLVEPSLNDSERRY